MGRRRIFWISAVIAFAAMSLGVAVRSSIQRRSEARQIAQQRAREIDLRMDVLANGKLTLVVETRLPVKQEWARLSQERRDILKGEYEANRSLFQKFMALFRD
jgi:heme exporter protein D